VVSRKTRPRGCGLNYQLSSGGYRDCVCKAVYEAASSVVEKERHLMKVMEMLLIGHDEWRWGA
jgi:hypothetical protein